MSDKLQPVEVKRDEGGYFMHPVLSHFWGVEMDQAENCTPEQWKAWATRHGIETDTAMLESYDLDHPAYVEYFDNGGNASVWEPEAPGPEWFLINIGDSEDGPFAVYARHLPTVE